MSPSNCSSRLFLTRVKTLLLLAGLMLILTDLAKEVNCERKLKRDKSRDSNANLDPKFPRASKDEHDDKKEYYYEEDTDIKITKTIPAIKPSSPAVPLPPLAANPPVWDSGMKKSIGNRIDNDRDLVVKVIHRNLPGRVINNSPSKPVPPSTLRQSVDENRLDMETLEGLGALAQTGMDPKLMKSIADDVADAILAEADKIYASLSPEEETSRARSYASTKNQDDRMPLLSSDKTLPQVGFSPVDDSSYVMCTSAE